MSEIPSPIFRPNALTQRPSPNTSPFSSPHMHTDEHATPVPIPAAAPQSFGHEFNLIRAVEEYGPQRVATITKELSQLVARELVLQIELSTLERLIAATKAGGTKV
jgi:hypothetical protein